MLPIPGLLIRSVGNFTQSFEAEKRQATIIRLADKGTVASPCETDADSGAGENFDQVTGMDDAAPHHTRQLATLPGEELRKVIVDPGNRAAGQPLFGQLQLCLTDSEPCPGRELIEWKPECQKIGAQ